MDKLNRKTFIAGTVSAAIAAGTGEQLFAEKAKSLSSKERNAIENAAVCVEKANICIAHCIELLGQGNKAMYECMRSATEMKAMCEAFGVMASQKSKLLEDVAEVCIEACEACEKACRKHAGHHQECKECADACEDCIKTMKKVA